MPVFVVGSANRKVDSSVLASKGNFHFTLARKSKDSADVVITMAATALQSLVVAYGRQEDVHFHTISNDKCFQTVTQHLRKAGALSASISPVTVTRKTRKIVTIIRKAPTKFHGTLTGKNAVVVQRVEQETDTTITFSTEGGGRVSICGDTVNCERVWSMFEHFKENLPPLLNKLRAGVLHGDLECVPFLDGQVDAELVGPLAVEEALMKFKKAKRMF